MKAWKIYQAGGPEAFVLEEVPQPEPKPGRVLIEVKAFGLNRSEWFTRRGDSPSVSFPRTLGIECVGIVVSAPGGEFTEGQKVCAMMGGMGREYDGSYAEYTSVPVSSVFALDTQLAWQTLGALPEMLQTCHGSLHTGLGLQAGQTLLIRGGTSSIGLTCLAMAKSLGARVISTSRSEQKIALLKQAGADEVLIDRGELSTQVKSLQPEGVDAVLELIGTTTLLDSLQCAKVGGTVCMTGILGGEWELSAFRPMGHIPTGVRLSSYSGGASDISSEQLQNYVSLVEQGKLSVKLGPSWAFEDLPKAHQAMDENSANGKMVILL